jgi:hypothetical protein
MPSAQSATVSTVRAEAAHEPGLRAAQAAPRCSHLKYNGEQCGCPALHGDTRCRFHVHADPKHFAGIPVIEDAAAIQLGILRILRALEFGSLDTRTAALMLYGLQIASSNLKRLEASFAIPAALAENEREMSLAETLLRRLDDEQFISDLTAAQREEERLAALHDQTAG